MYIYGRAVLACRRSCGGGASCELSCLAIAVPRRNPDRSGCRYSRLCFAFRHRRRRLPGAERTPRLPRERPLLARLCAQALPFFCLAHACLRRAQRRGHLVHHWAGQSRSHLFAHSHFCLGLGDRVGFLFRRNHCGHRLRQVLGQAAGARSPDCRLDLPRGRLAEPGGHQRHHHLHADAGKLVADQALRRRLLQSHILPFSAVAHGDLHLAGGGLRVGHGGASASSEARDKAVRWAAQWMVLGRPVAAAAGRLVLPRDPRILQGISRRQAAGRAARRARRLRPLPLWPCWAPWCSACGSRAGCAPRRL